MTEFLRPVVLMVLLIICWIFLENSLSPSACPILRELQSAVCNPMSRTATRGEEVWLGARLAAARITPQNYCYRETHMDCSNSAMTTFPSQLVLVRGSDTISLDMSSNRITNVSRAVESFYNSSVARHYANITRLYLSHNQIQTFNQESLPPALEELYLDNNHIARFQQSDINYFDSLVNRTNFRLRLGNNPYSCSCDSTPLFHFIKNRGAKLEDLHTVMMKCDSQLVKSKLN